MITTYNQDGRTKIETLLVTVSDKIYNIGMKGDTVVVLGKLFQI